MRNQKGRALGRAHVPEGPPRASAGPGADHFPGPSTSPPLSPPHPVSFPLPFPLPSPPPSQRDTRPLKNGGPGVSPPEFFFET